MSTPYTFSPDRAADLLSLMANEARLRVFALIMEEEWDVTSLAAAVNLSQSALSQHLKKLRDARVVQIRREAQTIYYSCKSDAIAKLIATLTDIFEDKQDLRTAA